MGRGSKTFKILKSSGKDNGVSDMFNDMLGNSSKDPNTFYPKYERLHDLIGRWLKLLDFTRDNVLGYFPQQKDLVADYITERKRLMANEYRFYDLPTECKLQLSEMPQDVRDIIFGRYQALKESIIVKSIIAACQNVIVYKTFIENQEKFNDKFLTKTAGLTYSPIEDLPALNFKQLYNNDNLDADDRRIIMLILHKMLNISLEVHEVMSSPDVNVDNLSEVILTAINNVKKRIPRCDAAFAKILGAVDTLKGNFNGYYQEYVTSNNPTTIMELFVYDVAKTSEPTPTLVRQFNKIIMYYQQVSQQHASNPKYKTLFGHLNKNMERIKQLSGRNVKSEDDAMAVLDEIDEKPLEDFDKPVELPEEDPQKKLAEDAADAIADELIAEEEAAATKKKKKKKKKVST